MLTNPNEPLLLSLLYAVPRNTWLGDIVVLIFSLVGVSLALSNRSISYRHTLFPPSLSLRITCITLLLNHSTFSFACSCTLLLRHCISLASLCLLTDAVSSTFFNLYFTVISKIATGTAEEAE